MIDQAIRAYLRRARANLEELNRRAQRDTNPRSRSLFQDLLTEYAGAIMMLQYAIQDGMDAVSILRPKSDELEFVTVIDPRGTFIYVSSAARMLGHEPAGLIGKSSFEFLHEDDLEGVYSNFRRGLENPEETIELAFRFRTAENGWAWIHCRSQNLSFGTQVDGFISRLRVIEPPATAV